MEMNLREWALPVYTILMQLSIGGFLTLWTIRSLSASKISKAELDRLTRNPLTILFFTVMVGIIGSHFHLSRPYLSFLAVLNVRSSWLSREVLFTVLFFCAIGSLWMLQMLHRGRESFITGLGWAGILLGHGAIFCMSRIYLLPTQSGWNTPVTIYSFFSTAYLLGPMAMAAIFVLDLKFLQIRKLESPETGAEIIRQSLRWLAVVAFVMVWVVIALNVLMVLSLRTQGGTAQISLELLLGLYQPLCIMRFIMLLSGVGWLVVTVLLNTSKKSISRDLSMPVYMACLLVMIGEILGRFLFYATHVRLGI